MMPDSQEAKQICLPDLNRSNVMRGGLHIQCIGNRIRFKIMGRYWEILLPRPFIMVDEFSLNPFAAYPSHLRFAKDGATLFLIHWLEGHPSCLDLFCFRDARLKHYRYLVPFVNIDLEIVGQDFHIKEAHPMFNIFSKEVLSIPFQHPEKMIRII